MESEGQRVMRMKDIGKIKDLRELREINTNDVIELLDELRGVATKRGGEILGQGRHQARRAIGAPDDGAVKGALVFGLLLGAALAAVVTLLVTPMAGREARRRLSEEVERVRERVPTTVRANGNGYEHEALGSPVEAGAAPGRSETPTA